MMHASQFAPALKRIRSGYYVRHLHGDTFCVMHRVGSVSHIRQIGDAEFILAFYMAMATHMPRKAAELEGAL